MCEWTDDRHREGQQTLDVGREAEATADRDPEVWGSARFGDDRKREPDPGEQSDVAPEELEGQADLTGEQAAKPPEWGEPE